jgi:hypothetical protein
VYIYTRISCQSWLDDLGRAPSEKYRTSAYLDSPPSTFEIQVSEKKKEINFRSGNKRAIQRTSAHFSVIAISYSVFVNSVLKFKQIAKLLMSFD